jgi:hypothetical protein
MKTLPLKTIGMLALLLTFSLTSQAESWVGNEDVSLGLARAALEYDRPDSMLVKKIGEIEKYFQRHFVRSK